MFECEILCKCSCWFIIEVTPSVSWSSSQSTSLGITFKYLTQFACIVMYVTQPVPYHLTSHLCAVDYPTDITAHYSLGFLVEALILVTFDITYTWNISLSPRPLYVREMTISPQPSQMRWRNLRHSPPWRTEPFFSGSLAHIPVPIFINLWAVINLSVDRIGPRLPTLQTFQY